MNIGLFIMCVISLLPVGLMQTWASVEKGYWYARSPEFLHTDADPPLAACAGRHVFRRIGALVLVAFVFVGGSGAAATLRSRASPAPIRVPSGD